MPSELSLDWETRSELDLRAVGLHNYSVHESTDIWCAAYAFDDEEPAAWLPGQPCPPRIVEHVKAGGSIHAWNAPFEIALWKHVAAPRHGWPELKVENVFCSMAAAYAMGLPGALEDAALALGLHVLKDGEGRSLMLRMSRPRSTKPTVWWSDPDKIARLVAYSLQDVRVEREARRRLMPLSEKERKVWLLDYRINQRGVAVDVETAKAAVAMTEEVKLRCNQELSRLTENAVQTVTAVAALKTWMEGKGVKAESLAKQALTDLLDTDLPDDVRRALILRQEAGKASTAKLDRTLNMVGADNRLRNMYQYHGAATGRWAGRGVQTSNLPRDMPPPEHVEHVLVLVRAAEYDAIDMIYGPPMTTISRCLRSFFMAEDGKVLISGDWSNVEGRGQAWFSGEQWKLDAFLAADNKTGPGLYELAYSRMFGVPVESVKNPSEERQVGKVAELAFGYQGGVGSFHTMGKNYGVKVSDAKADEFKMAWRNAHPKIVKTWYDIQRAAINAVKHPGEKFACGHPGREAYYKVAGSFLWCLLPSGRAICYPYPKILEGEYGPQLTYMTVPSPDKKGVIADPRNASNWARVSTYGGSLFNNIVQGFCRDFLVDTMLELDARGAQIVLHTYDDINVEVAEEKGEGAREAMRQLMMTPPAWAKGFPLFAKPALMRRYGK